MRLSTHVTQTSALKIIHRIRELSLFNSNLNLTLGPTFCCVCTVVEMNCRIGLLFSLSRTAKSCSQSAWMSSSEIPTLTLYTKDNCSLCDDAKEVLKKFPNKFELEEVDITSPENKEWFKRYRFDIPVFHFQGKYLMKHRVDSELLEKTLQEYHAAVK